MPLVQVHSIVIYLRYLYFARVERDARTNVATECVAPSRSVFRDFATAFPSYTACVYNRFSDERFDCATVVVRCKLIFPFSACKVILKPASQSRRAVIIYYAYCARDTDSAPEPKLVWRYIHMNTRQSLTTRDE